MRAPTPPAPPRIRTPSRDRRGLALITVLGTLALVTVLFLALFSSANTEIQSSRSYSANSAAQDLHDTAVNLVVSQIRTATSGLGSTRSWASQPGMIRRYGTTSADLEAAYKLYSSDVMTAGSNFDPANESPPALWQDLPALWTNLNQPTLQTNSTLRYPIIDPNLVGQVEGFSLEASPNIPPNSAAMPTRWLYVLEDGTVGHLGDAGTFVPPPGGNPATASNPITGRIAFWADDESSKVNINTASEGVFWDHPLGNTKTERGNAPAINAFPVAPFGYASSMAVRNEFPRYPGHPAETSISPVLGTALTLSPYPTSTELDSLYTLTPKIVLSGTRGGNIISHLATISPPDADRLYATADDFLFRPTAPRTRSDPSPQPPSSAPAFSSPPTPAPQSSTFSTAPASSSGPSTANRKTGATPSKDSSPFALRQTASPTSSSATHHRTGAAELSGAPTARTSTWPSPETPRSSLTSIALQTHPSPGSAENSPRSTPPIHARSSSTPSIGSVPR